MDHGALAEFSSAFTLLGTSILIRWGGSAARTPNFVARHCVSNFGGVIDEAGIDGPANKKAFNAWKANK